MHRSIFGLWAIDRRHFRALVCVALGMNVALRTRRRLQRTNQAGGEARDHGASSQLNIPVEGRHTHLDRYRLLPFRPSREHVSAVMAVVSFVRSFTSHKTRRRKNCYEYLEACAYRDKGTLSFSFFRFYFYVFYRVSASKKKKLVFASTRMCGVRSSNVHLLFHVEFGAPDLLPQELQEHVLACCVPCTSLSCALVQSSYIPYVDVLE